MRCSNCGGEFHELGGACIKCGTAPAEATGGFFKRFMGRFARRKNHSGSSSDPAAQSVERESFDSRAPTGYEGVEARLDAIESEAGVIFGEGGTALELRPILDELRSLSPLGDE